MTGPTRTELDEAVLTGAALVDQIGVNPQMVVDVVNGLTTLELRVTLIALAGAAAKLRDELTRLSD